MKRPLYVRVVASIAILGLLIAVVAPLVVLLGQSGI